MPGNGNHKVKWDDLYFVKEPFQMVDGDVQVVYWSWEMSSFHLLSELDLSKSNLCVVTTYKCQN